MGEANGGHAGPEARVQRPVGAHVAEAANLCLEQYVALERETDVPLYEASQGQTGPEPYPLGQLPANGSQGTSNHGACLKAKLVVFFKKKFIGNLVTSVTYIQSA